ncbi:isocitrate lyase/PEP mutase family protein [Verticiella alkaliphila]|uniref:isocitrate lyase/PEP mutase family protein n=1 Tax=Verticiella alkaliphila TaxID=2779529 RepID=UPI00209ADE0D|nr:oxaloacetate decarboxylase [Verticiella sp. GG226]
MTQRLTTRLRELLAGPRALMAPGVADPLFARIVVQQGFDALYMTGAGTSATRLGMPDVGLLTLTEMADNAARIVAASQLPLIADADNGFGGPLNVRRTVQEYERAGAAALHLEDQVLPKRCGHLAGKQLVSKNDFVAKIHAAVDARRDEDFVIIARTDAIAVEGFDAAIDRALAYKEAGADVLFVEAPSQAQLPDIVPRLDHPVLYNMATSGKTPFLKREEIEALGFKLIIYPNWMMLAAIKAATGVLQTLKSEGTIASIAPEVPSFQQFFDLVGMQDVRALEERYGVPEEARTNY